jgi:hypothetical protein
MPDGTDWGLAWIRLERAIQKKLDKLDNTKDDDETDFREVTHKVEVLEEVQELMKKIEPKDRRRTVQKRETK